MRRSAAIVASLALVLALAGCSSAVQGQAQVGSTPATASPTTSEPTPTSESTESTPEETTSEETTSEEYTSEETTSDDTTSEETSTETPPVEGLDPDTQAWFETFCQGSTDVAQYAQPDTSGQSLDEIQLTIVTAYSSISISAAGTVYLLETSTVPPIDGGQELHDVGVERFDHLATVYGDGATTIAALTLGTEEELATAVAEIEAKALDAPDTMAMVDQSVLDAARTLPQCEGVLG